MERLQGKKFEGRVTGRRAVREGRVEMGAGRGRWRGSGWWHSFPAAAAVAAT